MLLKVSRQGWMFKAIGLEDHSGSQCLGQKKEELEAVQIIIGTI